MKRLTILPILMVVLALLVAACVPSTAIPESNTPVVTETASPVPAASTPVATETPAQGADTAIIPETGGAGAEIGAFADLISAIEDSGETVVQGSPLQQPFFNVAAQVLNIDNQQVQVFEFPTPADRQQAQSLISANGSIIGQVMPSWIDTPHFWASGRLIALYIGQNEEIISLLDRLMGAQITTPEAGTGNTQSTPDIPGAATQAQRFLAEQLGVDTSAVEFVVVQQMTWPDACLGLPRPDESCAYALTPGWQVIMTVNGQQYEVRTDATGQTLRIVQR